MAPRWPFALLVLLTVACRFHYFDWPPNRDVTAYATIAHEMSHGRALYSELWDRKPPAIYATYLLAEKRIEHKPLRLFVLGLVPTLILLGLLARAGNAYGPAPRAGLLCGLTWALVSGDLLLQMPDANTEVFINVCLVAAFVVVLRLRRKHRLRLPAAAGALFAAATLYKPVAIPVAALLAAAHVALPPRDCPRLAACSQVATMAGTGALIWATTVGYFAITGRLDVFRETMIASNADYAGDLLHNIVAGVSLAPIVGEGSLRWLVGILPWTAGIALVAAHPGRRREWLLVVAYGFAALVAVALPGRFYAHYFQLLVPPAVIGVGWLGGRMLAGGNRAGRLVVLAVLAAILLWEARYYRGGPDRLLPGTNGEIYHATQRLGRRLARTMQPDEVLFQWGAESGLYFYSGKRPPAAILCWPLLRGPQASDLSRAALARLTARPPDLIVAARYFERHSREHPIHRWIESNYRRIEPEDPAERKFFVLFVPDGA